jgi:hypothetical protein
MINKNEFIKKLLAYYKRALETQEQLRQKFTEDDFVKVESDLKPKNQFLNFGIKNNDSYTLVYNFCDEYLKHYNEDKRINSQKTFEDFFEIYFSPLMIKIKDFYINPFYIKVNDFNHLSEILEAFHSQEFEKNIFKGNDLQFNTLLMIEPFELVDLELSTKLFKTLEDRNSDSRIDNIRQMFELLMDAVNSWLGKDYIIEEVDINRSIDGIYHSLNELYKRNKEKNSYSDKDIERLANPHVTVKVLPNSDENYNINGLLNVYRSVEQSIEKGTFDNNLLHYYISGSKHKYSPVPFESIENDEHTLVLNYTEIKNFTREHIGALTDGYDLTNSQKYCLNACKSNLKVIPVNGPPGTGKTSLLRAVIGDIVVHNAIESYNGYLKTKEIEFSTPIVSFSTNNKALSNIAKGIIEVLDESENILHSRWLNPSIDYFEKVKRDGKYIYERKVTNVNSAKLYAPLFKSGAEINQHKPFDSVVNWRALEFIDGNLKSNYVEHITIYLTNFNMLDLGFKIPEKNILEFKEQSLEMALNYLFVKLNELKFSIEEKADKVKIIDSYSRFNELLKEIVLFQNSSPLNIQTREQYQSYCLHLESKLNLFYQKYAAVQNKIASIKENFQNKYEKLNEESMIETSKYNQELSHDIKQANNSINEKIEKIEKEYNKQLKNLTLIKEKSLFEIENNFDGIFNKIKNFFTKEKNILMDSVIEKYDNDISIAKNKMDEYVKKSKEEHSSIIITIKDRYDEIKNKTIEKYNKLIANIENESKKQIEIEQNRYKEATVLFQLHELEHHEALKKVDIFRNLVEEFKNINIEFFQEFTHRLNEEFKGDDLNVRTKSMFYALHILEGLLLIDIVRNLEISKKQQTQKCFACNKQTLQNKTYDNKIKYRCSSCGATLVNNPVKKLGRPLSKDEIIHIITFRNAEIEENTYTLLQNKEEGKEMYWNVVQGNSTVNDDRYRLFKNSSVLFPVLNTTCHSFGTMFGISEDRTVPTSFIEHMFVDEAGMILTPYMVNLFAGKNVFLFGDELQIKPVYPFSDHKIIYDYLINRYFHDEEEKKTVNDFYSIENSNAMKIANNSTFIYNPMYTVDLEGDAWLLEHFRCKKSIIDYCNKEFYNNYMIPHTVDEVDGDHLDMIDHEFQSSKDGDSRINKDEANLIIDRIISSISEPSNLTENDRKYLKSVGIITPFAAQEKILKNILEAKGLDKYIKYGTVHKFQGSEQETIYFSTTVGINNTSASDTYMINTAQPNVINVAVSRAKNKFILVGNIKNLQLISGSYTTKLVEHINNYKNKKFNTFSICNI